MRISKLLLKSFPKLSISYLSYKLMYSCQQRGLIEDIIVNNEYRGKQLGKILLAILVEIGKAVGCYKITLNCKDELVKFYNSFGLIKESGNANFMILRVDK